MIEDIQTLLCEYETELATGRITGFTVFVVNKSLKIIPEPENPVSIKSIILSPELFQTLDIFFSGIKGISFGTFDYTTLKSLLNAHGALVRMAHKSNMPSTNE